MKPSRPIHRIGRSIALRAGLTLSLAFSIAASIPATGAAEHPSASSPGNGTPQIEVVKKGLGKEVTIRAGDKEWYMLIEVTEGNSVVIRQEKDRETYLRDESETHDHAWTKAEVDAAIEDFINSVTMKTRRRP